ncbi:MAG: hypothetical protein CME06_02045 [Gemmatimonadetes bacterium]|nr:hypothetical protein [Gemmatimonadota bacterium]
MSTECPGCAVTIERDTSTCPICGYEFPRHPARFRILTVAALAGFALFLFAGLGRGCGGP